ncbi:MAG: BT_3928 family protein [Bacteroidota bacterium]|jgi:uncharacterized membrane protein YphA (DoxX/SURF4 family)
MNKIIFFIRWFVGVLFIFSGLVKANDPHGLSYKMQEFFEAWNMHGLHDFTLSFAVLMNAFEIIAGIALIIGWRMRMFSWLLLLLIVFFTFLTAYATYATNPDGSMKFRSCGCFGDCIPLDPRQSFWKDIVLLVLTILLFAYRNKIQPVFKAGFLNVFVVILGVVFSFGFQVYTLQYLPVVDCLPYKKGNHILPLREIPADAVPDQYDIRFVYSKKGVQQEFPMSSLPDSTWTFVARNQVLVKKGENNEPPVKDFILTDAEGNDVTTDVLSLDKVHYLVFILNLDDVDQNMKWLTQLEALSQAHTVHIVTSVADQVRKFMSFSAGLAKIPVLSCDGTAIKTAARTVPVLYKMHKDEVLDKKSGADAVSWK